MISDTVRQLVTERDNYRCLYCHTSQHNTGLRLQIDHIIPLSQGGASEPDNLCLACFSCNSHKQARRTAVDPESNQPVDLFHPLRQSWASHFTWDDSGTTIIGLTACGRATIEALRMNNDTVVLARRRWVETGWHPPS